MQPADILAHSFAVMLSLLGKPCPREVLETRCLSEWVKVYEVNDHPDAPGRLSLWHRLRIHCKQAFRTSVCMSAPAWSV